LIQTLVSATHIAAEDTRVLKSLANHLGIKLSAKIMSLHEHNEAQRAEEIARRLAAGEKIALLTDAGTPLDPDELVDLEMPMARAEGDELIAHALSVDSFGNVSLDLEHEELAGFGLRLGLPVKINGSEGVYTTTFADAPEGGLLIYEDPYRSLALAVNRGSAAEQLGIDRDDEVRIQPA